MKLKKLDRRHRGNQWFKWAAEYRRSADIKQFIEHRAWAWSVLGASCELQHWPNVDQPNQRWAWCSDEWNTRIYLASDADLNWFKLTHGVGL